MEIYVIKIVKMIVCIHFQLKKVIKRYAHLNVNLKLINILIKMRKYVCLIVTFIAIIKLMKRIIHVFQNVIQILFLSFKLRKKMENFIALNNVNLKVNKNIQKVTLYALIYVHLHIIL